MMNLRQYITNMFVFKNLSYNYNKSNFQYCEFLKILFNMFQYLVKKSKIGILIYMENMNIKKIKIFLMLKQKLLDIYMKKNLV